MFKHVHTQLTMHEPIPNYIFIQSFFLFLGEKTKSFLSGFLAEQKRHTKCVRSIINSPAWGWGFISCSGTSRTAASSLLSPCLEEEENTGGGQGCLLAFQNEWTREHEFWIKGSAENVYLPHTVRFVIISAAYTHSPFFIATVVFVYHRKI